MCEIGVGEDFADKENTLADWKAKMARKPRNSPFDQALENLRADSFEVVPFSPVAGGVLVSKHGAAAVLVADPVAGAAFAECPGLLVKGEVARLLDRGYQKFLKTTHFEIPATASQLHSIHRFAEELRRQAGVLSLYNDGLGTTSDRYQYDRVKGREAVLPAPVRPWDLVGGH